MYQQIQKIETEATEIEKENHAMASTLDQTDLYGVIDGVYRDVYELALKRNRITTDLLRPKRTMNQIKKDITKQFV